MIYTLDLKKTLTIVTLVLMILFVPLASADLILPASTLPVASKDMVFIIDAGHGGFDGGAVSRDGVAEKGINLQIAKFLKTELLKTGATVIMTRDSDVALAATKKDDIFARLQIAKSNPNAIFISIHCNKFTQPEYSGLQTFYAKTAGSAELATLIQQKYNTKINTSCKRVPQNASDSVYLMRNAVTPAIIVECGFLSNEAETNLLQQEEYQMNIAKIISEAIIEQYIERK